MRKKKGTEINEGNNSKEEIYVEYGWKSLQFTFLYASVIIVNRISGESRGGFFALAVFYSAAFVFCRWI